MLAGNVRGLPQGWYFNNQPETEAKFINKS
jgi:hypothetical protein